MNIWALGDAVVDLLPLSDMQYQACAGGAPFNVAIGTARLSRQSGFIGRVGDDDFGHFLKQTLSEAGVSTTSLQLDNQHKTSTVLVSLGNDGERGFTFLTNPSADQFLTSAALPDFSDDILHFCSLALVAGACRNTLSAAIDQIKQRGGLLSFDVNLREQMWPDKYEMLKAVRHFSSQADILKLSEEELYWMIGTQDFAQALDGLKALPAQLKVVTYGAQGAMVLWQDNVIHFNGYTVDSIDTTGAGDAFVAGLLAWLADNRMPECVEQLSQAIAWASGCGALATTRKGALTALPDIETLNTFITQCHLPDYEIKSV
ncbi:aminoimidazole riboside kinase [Yokenella regensburgei]|jgi:fructokinase|uniref:aminoimidazole riboside kinase n=1 Tax=Yokenella regensburgei TaxID=158877 RepID=UPI001433240E|nr:aminoimidazole riboside kinase [Yokenella regensburgei]MDQ4431023.1 aminoimidazole riboside kinase [Yokenella regensburgei]QIU91881.1 aminoimidazole riboside kinase [Yokenella regensburgei]